EFENRPEWGASVLSVSFTGPDHDRPIPKSYVTIGENRLVLRTGLLRVKADSCPPHLCGPVNVRQELLLRSLMEGKRCALRILQLRDTAAARNIHRTIHDGRTLF